MDSWSRGGGGRGRGNRGRGRGYYDHGNNNRQNYYDNDGGNNSISSRLGPLGGNTSGGDIASRLGPMPGGNLGFDNQYNKQQPQQGFSQNYQQPRGRGRGGGRGGYQNNSSNDYNPSLAGGFQNSNDNYNNSDQYTSRGGGRNQSFSTRGRGRGGGFSQGSRGQFTRDFVDDDIDMGNEIPADAPVIMVSGYPPSSERDLLGFLHRKSKVEWEELNVQNQNGVTYITVDGPASVDALIRKNGYTFKGSILSIALADSSTPSLPMRQTRPPQANQQQGKRPNALAEFLQERWDPQQGFLNLDDLPPTSHSIAVVISRLLNEASNIYGNSIVTVSFARNKLWSLQPINKLATLLPGVRNLSVQENDISEFRHLNGLSNNKLPNLTELVLLGNPIQTESSPDMYISEITRRFPSISQLDFQPVNQNSGAGGTLAPPLPSNDGSLPLPIKASFFDQDSSRQAAQDLLSKFFPLFDSNRLALADLYDSQSTFSINVSSTCYAKTTWNQGQRLTIGNDNISKRFAMFPPTIHDLSHAENFVTDAWQTPGSSKHPVLLFLTVHGSFREASGEVSFDRVFLIAPSPPGSRSQSAGWQYVILSDSMIIRNHSFLPTV